MKKFEGNEKEFVEPYLMDLIEGSFRSSESIEEFTKKIFDDIINVKNEEIIKRAIRSYEKSQKF